MYLIHNIENLWSGSIRVILQVILHSKLKVFGMLIHCLWYIQTQYEISTFFVKSVKGGLILESFSRFLKSPKKVPKTFLCTTHKLKKLRIVIWYFLGEIETENFLRLSHLYFIEHLIWCRGQRLTILTWSWKIYLCKGIQMTYFYWFFYEKKKRL